MRFYVVSPNGQKYGPADVDVLNQWIAEGRLVSGQTVEIEGSGQQVVANTVPGIMFPLSANYNPPAPFVPSAPSNFHTGELPGKQEITLAWVLAACQLLPCVGTLPISGAGLYFALQAKKKGHPSGQAAVIFSALMIGLFVASMLGFGFPPISPPVLMAWNKTSPKPPTCSNPFEPTPAPSPR